MLLETAQKTSKRIIDDDPSLSRPENAVLYELVTRLIEKGSEMN